MRFPIALLIVLSISLLHSCQRKTSVVSKSSVPQISIQNSYQSINLDTILRLDSLKIGNDQAVIESKIYSLNDSAIVHTSNLDDSIQLIEYSHRTEVHLRLLKQGILILDTVINNEILNSKPQFKTGSDFKIVDLKYHFIRSNRIYLKLEIGIPETQELGHFELAIFYRTNKKGQIDIWEK